MVKSPAGIVPSSDNPHVGILNFGVTKIEDLVGLVVWRVFRNFTEAFDFRLGKG